MKGFFRSGSSGVSVRQFLLFALVLFLFFFSCSSSGGFRIPGEKNRIYENVLSEYYSIADAYLENKKYTKAVEFYTKALAHPDLEESARYKIAQSYALAEDWAHAIPAYQQLLEADPGNTALETSLAYLYARNGDLDRSSAAYRSLTEKNPYDQSLLEDFITVLLAGNYLEEAELALNRLKTDFPDNTTAEELDKKLAAGWEAQEGRPAATEETPEESTGKTDSDGDAEAGTGDAVEEKSPSEADNSSKT